MTIGALIAPLSDQLVDAQSEARAVAIPEPEDARRQALERDPLAGQPNPAAERLVVGEHLERRAIGDEDVLRIAGQRGPPERALALAEQRTNVFGHEARDCKRVGDAGLDGLRANVVAVVEGDRAAALHLEHRRHVSAHGGDRSVVRTPPGSTRAVRRRPRATSRSGT